MGSSSGTASLLTRSLSAFVAFVCSLSLVITPAYAQTSTATSSESLFGFELQLDSVRVWVAPDGREYVGWPKEDAEVILHVFEKRIPLMKEIIQGHERLELIQDKQIATVGRMATVSSTIADEWQQVANGWKQAAKAGETSLWEDIFLGREFWFLVGLAAGAVGAKLLLD